MTQAENQEQGQSGDPVPVPAPQTKTAPTIWFETELLLLQADYFSSPTGIERVSLELFGKGQEHYAKAGRVKFCRMSFYTGQLRSVDYETIANAYSGEDMESIGLSTAESGLGHGWRRVRQILRWMFRYAMPVVRDVTGEKTVGVKPGDVILCVGDPWFNPRYCKHVAAIKRRHDVKFALLLHDLAPLIVPHHFPPLDVRKFRQWIAQMVTLCDVIFVSSEFSRKALLEFADRNKWMLPPIEKLDFGAGFSVSRFPGKAAEEAALPLPPSFVLYVSTIESRKNHMLLIRVWQRLIKKHGADRTPSLVFVGDTRWQSDGVLHQLQTSRYLDGKIMVLCRLSDARLDEVYQRSLFTVYPSTYEGWGLPVAESLLHGKHCVASSATAIPEVGGAFADYFDPYNDADAFEKIERAIFEPGYIVARERRLASEYKPPDWGDCMHAIVRKLDGRDASRA